jgi:hypothetical protein
MNLVSAPGGGRAVGAVAQVERGLMRQRCLPESRTTSRPCQASPEGNDADRRMQLGVTPNQRPRRGGSGQRRTAGWASPRARALRDATGLGRAG